MCQLKHLIQRVLGIVLLGCLALSLAPNVYAQRKAQSGEALLKEIERATDSSKIYISFVHFLGSHHSIRWL